MAIGVVVGIQQLGFDKRSLSLYIDPTLLSSVVTQIAETVPLAETQLGHSGIALSACFPDQCSVP